MWQKYAGCVNCGTTDRPHRGSGYCNKCHGPAMQLREVLAWDQSRPETLHRYPGRPESVSARHFALVKEGYAAELQRRLDTLRHWESSRDEPADPIDIEFQLSRIARYAGARSRILFANEAGYIGTHVPAEQRRVLRELLRKIEKDRPWPGVDLRRVFAYRDAALYGNRAAEG
jgi:hypothetical protein